MHLFQLSIRVGYTGTIRNELPNDTAIGQDQDLRVLHVAVVFQVDMEPSTKSALDKPTVKSTVF